MKQKEHNALRQMKEILKKNIGNSKQRKRIRKYLNKKREVRNKPAAQATDTDPSR